MAKRKMNENSLSNLEPEKHFFNAETAQKAQLLSVKKQKENRLMKQVAAEALVKKIKGVDFQQLSIEKLTEYCLSIDADIDTVLKVLTFLRDTAGQKPKEDVQAVVMPVINIKGL